MAENENLNADLEGLEDLPPPEKSMVSTIIPYALALVLLAANVLQYQSAQNDKAEIERLAGRVKDIKTEMQKATSELTEKRLEAETAKGQLTEKDQTITALNDKVAKTEQALAAANAQLAKKKKRRK